MQKLTKTLGLQACLLLTLLGGPTSAYADEPYLGEIRWFAGNFAPRGWAFCDGQLLPISQNEALFSLLGTIYGGDGRTTFALPDMRGRVSMHFGAGPGLTNRPIGGKGGSEEVSVGISSIPGHSHDLHADDTGGDNVKPDARYIAGGTRFRMFSDSTGPLSSMDSEAVTATGGNQAHNNIQPNIVANCIIALQGLYPSRN